MRMLAMLCCVLTRLWSLRLTPPLVHLGVFVFAFHAAIGWASITGVCPDGSVFVVRSPQDIPCPGAKRMEPDEVPPMRPEYLPRPYTWEVYEKQGDPNNPYNLIDAARKVRTLGGGSTSAPDSGEGSGSPPPEQASGARSGPSPATGAGFAPRALGFRDEELQGLFQIVALSQERAPAAFVKQTADGRETLRIAFAHSRSFAGRMRPSAGWGSSGPVLLFSALARQAETLGDQFTFVQGHLAFHPRAEDARQMGVLQGTLGDLQPGEAVLGYVVLPDSMDLRQPMDVYWNDRRLSATFEP